MADNTFIREPRAPFISEKYPQHRYYGNEVHCATVGVENSAGTMRCNVSRNSPEQTASVGLLYYGMSSHISCAGDFSPRQLREIACALIDASADIEAHPVAQAAATTVAEVAA